MELNITVLIDDKNSWFVPYGQKLNDKLNKKGIKSELVFSQDDANGGDICFLLSCTKIVKKNFLSRYVHNIVIHASDLPEGKGFTPMKWQIREGKNDIVLTLFEAVEAVDAGPWYMKENIHYTGYELLDELQQIMAEKIICMALEYTTKYETILDHEQKGEETIYRRFRDEDDRLDVDKSIREQFNHLRTADNERFPLWFDIDGYEYEIRVSRRKK